MGLRSGLKQWAADSTEELEGVDSLIPTFAPSPFSRIVDVLAWTRSGQVYTPWEDALTYPDPDADLCDLPAATRELQAMRLELTT